MIDALFELIMLSNDSFEFIDQIAINTPTTRVYKKIRSDQVFIAAKRSSINSTAPSRRSVK